MITAIRAEWIKFRSVRSTLVLLASGGIMTVVFGVLIANAISDQNRVFNLTDVTAGSSIAIYLFGTLGVQIVGQEYRFNTIRSTFSARPDRLRVLLAKMIVVSATVAVMALVMQLVCVLIGELMLDPFEIDGTDERAVLGTVVFAIGWTLVGVGVGAIVRQPVAGIVILLVEGAVVEGLVAGLFSWTVPWLPYLNGSQMMFRNESPDPDWALRSPLEGGIYFFVVTAVVLAIGAWSVSRRDA